MGKNKKKNKVVSKPSVSIVTCTQLKRVDFLQNLSRIIEKQEYENIIEWIIVNGSQIDIDHDELDQKLKLITCDKTEIIIISSKSIQKKNIGAFRNLANRSVSGDIIVCMDDDDYYFPSYIKSCVDSLNRNKGHKLVGCSAMLMYDYGFDSIFSLKSFGPNHTVNCCLAYRREYANNHLYQEETPTGEEKSFLDDYRNDMIQLPQLNSIIHMSYADNTYSEKRLNMMNNMVANIDNSNVPKIYNETDYKLSKLINDEEIYRSFEKNFQGINNKRVTDVTFYYGSIENEWHPLSNDLKTIQRRSIELGKRLTERGISVSIYGKFPFNELLVDNLIFYNLKYFNVKRKTKNLIFMDFNGFIPIGQYEKIYKKINAENIYLDIQTNFFQIKKYLRNYHDNIQIIFKNIFHKHMNPEKMEIELPNEKPIKHIIVPNGINKENFLLFEDEKRIKNRFCYTSNYCNGIEPLLKYCWPKIIEFDPTAELHIYYGMNESKLNEEGIEIVKELFLQDGVYEHGRVSHDEIAREFKKSSFLLYFTSTPLECDCISVMEALASGCIPIIWNQNIFSRLNGLQVDQDPRQRESYDKLANKLFDLINEDENVRRNVIDKFKNSDSIITWDYSIDILISYFNGEDPFKIMEQKKIEDNNKKNQEEIQKQINDDVKKYKEIRLRKKIYNLPEFIDLNPYILA